MSEEGRTRSRKRVPLTRERVLRGAIAVADADGIDALTMRSLAHAVGVKPMALYHHVAGKDEILDGIVDAVFAEIELPTDDLDWASAVHRRSVSAREVLRAHPWAAPLMDSRTTPGPATLRHHDAMLGTLRRGGFSVPMAGHAIALLDSYVYGFAIQEAALPLGDATAGDLAQTLMAGLGAEEYPHLVEFATERVLQPGYDFGNEFEVGLEMILDALARKLSDQVGAESPRGRSGRVP